MAKSRPASSRPTPLPADELRRIDAYWRACNYLAAGMIYLQDNPLLREPLQAGAHQEPAARPLGRQSRALLHVRAPQPPHQQVRPGRDLPGRPGPRRPGRAGARSTWRAPTPRSTRTRARTRRACGHSSSSSPSRAASAATARPETPGSIHEGGELGYCVSHAFGAAFDNPDLLVAVVVGDGESETGPLATSWHSNKFLNPIRDGAVLPILHLNGYKINNPTLLARISHEELDEPVPRLRLDAPLRRGRRPRRRCTS